jgi:hypothetical protein
MISLVANAVAIDVRENRLALSQVQGKLKAFSVHAPARAV